MFMMKHLQAREVAMLIAAQRKRMEAATSSSADNQQQQQHACLDADPGMPSGQSETIKIASLHRSKATSCTDTFQSKRVKGTAVPLEDLPQPALSVLIRCIGERSRYHDDRKGPSPLLNIMRTSKKMAQAVLETLPHQYSLDRQANWFSVRQVLMWNQVANLHLDITSAAPIPPLGVDAKALTMLLGHHPTEFTGAAATTSICAGVQHVTIKSDSMSPVLPWLLPPSLVTCCPNLKSLHLQRPKFRLDTHGMDGEPLLTCTSLTSLSLDNCTTPLPQANHSSEQLRLAMPNINQLTLQYTQLRTAEVLLKAWKTGLTGLTIDTLTDEWMEQLLKLPNVTRLQFRESAITRDWRQQAQHLRWTELVVNTLNWLHMGWLPLQRLNKLASLNGQNLIIEFDKDLEPETASIASKALENASSGFEGVREISLIFPDRHHGCCYQNQIKQFGLAASVLPRDRMRTLMLTGALHPELAAAICKQLPYLVHLSICVDTTALLQQAFKDLLAVVSNNCTHLANLVVLESADTEHAHVDDRELIREIVTIVAAAMGLAKFHQPFMLTLQGHHAVCLMKSQGARECFEQRVQPLLPKHMSPRYMYQCPPDVDSAWGHLTLQLRVVK